MKKMPDVSTNTFSECKELVKKVINIPMIEREFYSTNHTYFYAPHYCRIQSLINISIEYFGSEEGEKEERMHKNLIELREGLKKAFEVVETILGFADEFDYSVEVKANGYRSLICVFETFVKRFITVIERMYCTNSEVCHKSAEFPVLVDEIDAWRKAIHSFGHVLRMAIQIRNESDRGSLFSNNKHCQAELFESFKDVEYDCFYGRCLGFQFHQTMGQAVQFSRLSFVCYSQVHAHKNFKLCKAVKSGYTLWKCMYDPELMGKEMTILNDKVPSNFLTAYCARQELGIAPLTGARYYNFDVDTNITVPNVDFEMTTTKGQTITIPAPKRNVICRLISHKARDEMPRGVENEDDDVKSLPLSDSILIFIHGGGFVASTSTMHQLYLKDWATKLKVPIFCIDYTLAPEAQFPVQIGEVFFAYCWALKNMEILGSTGHRVIVSGDSAGGNLSLAISMKCIEMNLRAPDGLLLIYALCRMDAMSPSRLLQLMDPTIPFGLLVKCLSAYVGDLEAPENDPTQPPESHPYLSPLLQKDEILAKLPPCVFVSTNLDLLLDDNVSMAKKLKSLGVKTRLNILRDLPHGFLLFNWFSREAQEGSKTCCRRLRELLKGYFPS